MNLQYERIEQLCRQLGLQTVVSGNVKMTPQQHLKIDPLG